MPVQYVLKMKISHFLILLSVSVISISFLTAAFAQNDPTLQYGSKPQTQKDTPEQLHKKLVNARDAISNMMGSKMGNIPFNEVGIDEINSILDVGIDSSKTILSEEQYVKKIKEIVGDVPIKITFGPPIQALPLILKNNSVRGNDIVTTYTAPLKQFRSGIALDEISCKEGFYLAIKSHNKEPTCLSSGTISKLASRGFLYHINASETNYTTVLIPPGSENPSTHNTYSPNVVTVVIGVNNTIRWVSQSDSAVNIIVPDMPLQQDGKSFGSDVIKPDGSYQFTFTEPGTFGYHGEPHPWQKGIVAVLSTPNQITSAKFDAGIYPFSINVTNTNFKVNYNIFQGQVKSAILDMPSKSLILSITTSGNGTLVIDLPRALVDPKIKGEDSAFVVFDDGQEVLPKQIVTTGIDRVLDIPFQYGISQIQIIATDIQ